MEKKLVINLQVTVSVNYDESEISKQQSKQDIIEAVRDCALNKLIEEGVDSSASIESINVTESAYHGVAWSCSRDDFSYIHEYDLSDISEEEIITMIDEVDCLMSADDLVGDTFSNAIETVAQEHHLKHIPDYLD